jgi:Arc/MetJ family transcription regulator
MEELEMGRTSIVLDDDLVEKCQEATGIKTRRELIDHALRELLRHEEQRRILELKGAVEWEGDLAVWREVRTS